MATAARLCLPRFERSTYKECEVSMPGEKAGEAVVREDSSGYLV